MHIIIIGATAAGTSVAAKVRRLLPNKNIKITMYEKTGITSFGSCGLPFFVGGFFDSINEMIARTPEEFEKQNINVKLYHEIIFVDSKKQIVKIKNLKTQEETSEPYDHLMIATGADPIIPSFAIPMPQGVFLLRYMTDGQLLREALNKDSVKKVVIIGGGYIGLEVMVAVHKLGKKVVVVEMGKQLMPASFDQEFSEYAIKEIKEHNIELKLSCTVKELIGNPIKKVVTDQSEISCDLVVVSIGVKPATKFLENLQLNTLSNGAIIVNEKGETNIKNIWAGGDCAASFHLLKKNPVYIPLATVANKIGRIIGENIANQDKKIPLMLGAASLQIFDLEAARVGLTENEAKNEGYITKTTFIEDLDHTTYHPPYYPIYVKLIYEQKTLRILGGQIFGKMGAALRVHALSVAITKGLTTQELGVLDFAYSPTFSRSWDVLNIAGNVSK